MRTKLVSLEVTEWDKTYLRQQIAETSWDTEFFVPKVEFKIFLEIVKDIIKNECTETQQQYFNQYYFCSKSMVDISKDFDVKASTVARTIERAEKKVFSSRLLMRLKGIMLNWKVKFRYQAVPPCFCKHCMRFLQFLRIYLRLNSQVPRL